MSRMRRAVSRAAGVLPDGSGVVGIWVVVTGLTTYGFLAVAGRALGPDRYGGLSALWALGFLVGPGACLPLEQEVARALASRRARGLGGGPVVRRAAIGAAVLAAVLAGLALAAGPELVARLFDDDALLLVGLVLLLVGYALEYLVRGVLAGNERFGAYGRLLGGEGGSRLVVAAVLAVVGVGTAGPYGIVLGLAPFAGVAIALVRRTGLVPPGPPAPWRELSRALGWLLGASLLAQTLVNAGPILVQVLAPTGDEDEAGRFLATLVVARIPVFLFQAVQAVLLPRLAGHEGTGAADRLGIETRRMVLAVAGLCVVATLGAFTFGPAIVRIAWGADFALGQWDFALLAAASSVYLLALTLSQALIALREQARVTAGWLVGVVGLAIGVAVTVGLPRRVELGYLAGAVLAALAMGVLLVGPLRRARVVESEAARIMGSAGPHR